MGNECGHCGGSFRVELVELKDGDQVGLCFACRVHRELYGCCPPKDQPVPFARAKEDEPW
jgi:hypothetical protein